MSHETQSLNRVRDQAQKQTRDLNGFDYNAPAELYPSRIKKGRGRITYSVSTRRPKRCVSPSRKFPPRYCSVRTLRSTRRGSAFRKSASSTTAQPIR